MKYNQVLGFRGWLSAGARATPLAPSSALSYTKAIDQLLKDQYILDTSKLDVDKMLSKLEDVKYKNAFSKYKNAFLYFCEYQNITLSREDLDKIETMNENKKKKRRKQKPMTLQNIEDHVNVIRDKKLKLSYKTMLETGLRVSELSQIKKEDTTIDDDSITLTFVGKGGNNERVVIYKKHSPYVYEGVKNLAESPEPGSHLFYSSDYLQKEASKRGFGCHDLRYSVQRIFCRCGIPRKKDSCIR